MVVVTGEKAWKINGMTLCGNLKPPIISEAPVVTAEALNSKSVEFHQAITVLQFTKRTY